MSDADMEFKRKFLQRLKGQIQTEMEMSDKVKAYNLGITIPESDLRTRTEKIADQNVQVQKMKSNLVDLFGDDDESIAALFDYFKDNFADTIFFNQNFKKIYADLDNNIDIEYLNWNYFIPFYERFKEIYQNGKFGVLTAKDIQEANLELLTQQQPGAPATAPATGTTGAPATGGPSSPTSGAPASASAPAPAAPVPTKGVSLLNNDKYTYLKQIHSESEYGLAIEDLAQALQLNTGLYMTQTGTLRKPNVIMQVINRVFKTAARIIQLRQSNSIDTIDREKEKLSKDLSLRFSTPNEAMYWADGVMDTIVAEILDGVYQQIDANKRQFEATSVQAKQNQANAQKEAEKKQNSDMAKKNEKDYQKKMKDYILERDRFYQDLEQYQNETAIYPEQMRQYEEEMEQYKDAEDMIKAKVGDKIKAYDKAWKIHRNDGIYEHQGKTYTYDFKLFAFVDDVKTPTEFLHFVLDPDIDDVNVNVLVTGTYDKANSKNFSKKVLVENYTKQLLKPPVKPQKPLPPKPMAMSEPVRGAGIALQGGSMLPSQHRAINKSKPPPKRVITLLEKLGYRIV